VLEPDGVVALGGVVALDELIGAGGWPRAGAGGMGSALIGAREPAHAT
jgi:hypothetical protein